MVDDQVAAPMTPARLRHILELLFWGPNRLAAILDINERVTRRWLAGSRAVPDDVQAWLETLAAVHDANPPPVKPDLIERRAS